MSTGIGGANVDNLGGGEIVKREVIVTTTQGKQVYEGSEGEEVLKRVELEGGDIKHYRGGKGAERIDRIVSPNGDVKTYKGTTDREYCTAFVQQGVRTTLYGGACESTYVSVVVDHVSREVHWFKRTGDRADTSLYLRKMDKFGKFFARRNEEDQWKDVALLPELEMPPLTPEEIVTREAEERLREAEKRLREEKETLELSAKRSRYEMGREAGARLNGGFDVGGHGGVQGEDMAPEGDAESHFDNFEQHDQANSC
jgi:hypothetical protein